MFFFTYTAAVLTIFFVGAAVFLFLKGQKNTLTYIFILYILADAIWIGGNAVADISQNDSMLIISSGIAFVGSSCIVTFFLIFVDTFVDGKLPSLSRIILYSVPSVLFAIFSFSKYAVLDTIYPQDAPAQIVPGIQYYFFLLFLIIEIIYVLSRLIRFYKKSTGTRRLQTIYITIGFIALIAGGITFGLVLPLFGEFRFYNLAPQFSFVLAITSGYAIFRHNLLDIRIALQRGIIYTILLIGIIVIYLLLLNISGILFQQITQVVGIISAGITTIIGIFSVPYIDAYLRRKTDKFFFKNHYNYAEALYGLSEKINRNVSVENIKRLTEDALQEIFKTKTVITNIVKIEYATVEVFSNTHSDNTTLTIPIILDEATIGTIFLGEKKSGDYYTHEDIVLIRTFAHQIAVAFEKARLYKEVQDYSAELEKRVLERTEQIITLQENQTQMMLDISHKLQNPLTIIKNEISLLQKEMPKKSEFIFFEKTVDDISAFMYDLLHLARLDVTAESLDKEKLNLSEHIQELIEYFDVVAEHNNIQLISYITPDIEFICNKEKITELLTNIVSNSVKYIGTKEENTIIISLSEEPHKILLTIEDTGIGIDEKDITHIFERFYRTKSNQTKVKGTGLGLAICKKIVEIHGGTIAVTSRKNTYTKFSVSFPTTQVRKNDAKAA